ncbi:MAG: glucuronate isomerase [Melioribacteraceae bacterium]|nr:glucuronate isomerase [Melioribacteraceae bacterium]
MSLNEYRYFDPNPKVRETAFALYKSVKDLPIICPHGHVDPKILATNEPFPNPSELLIIPDHYIFRMFYSQGIDLKKLGIPTIDGSEVEKDPRKIWKIFADNYYLFPGTPTGAWMNHVLTEVFEIEDKLNSNTANSIYDAIQAKLNTPEFKPRTLFEKFNIEVLNTTDGASDSLEYHKQIRESGWDGRVVPCFRPDAAVNILAADWKKEIEKLSEVSSIKINNFSSFINAIENRREFFKSMGAVSTDQGVFSSYTHRLSESEADAIFKRALNGEATKEDNKLFTANMLMEMARMSIDDGLVMQIHPGSFRNHNSVIFNQNGLDKGCDIPVQTEYTNNLHELLNTYGNNTKLKLIVFTLDESNYARELAPLAGHYPAMKLGPAWWFHDSIEGMTRYRQMVTGTAGFYNTVGFNDDTRAFLSIPARHDVARRVDSNYLAGLVEKHLIDKEEAVKLSYELANGLVKKAYNL